MLLVYFCHVSVSDVYRAGARVARASEYLDTSAAAVFVTLELLC
jgi:hypothetical protein